MEQPDPKHYNDFLQNSIQLLDALVLGIELPAEIVAAINRQTQQYYEIQEYKYRVEREAQESTRKQIEANGIAAFQRTVSEGISDSYLRWRGIEATLALAQSRNSKIVIIGGGKDGLPIILGNVDGVAGSNSKATAVEGDTTPNEGGPNEKISVPAPGQLNTLPRPAGVAPNPSAPDKNSGVTIPGTPPNVTQVQPSTAPGSNLPFDLSQFKNYVPNLPEWLRSATSGAGPGTGAPKQ
jgi:hypothetical protein